MGYNIHLLEEGHAEPGLSHSQATTLELHECVHFHQDEFRFVWTTDEFLAVSEAFNEASTKIKDLGSPPDSPHYIRLGGNWWPGKRLQNNRNAIEIVSNNIIHLHHKHLRVHMARPDFFELGDLIKTSLITMGEECHTVLDITGPNIKTHPITDKYIQLLDQYEEEIATGKRLRVQAKEVSRLHAKVKWYRRHPNGDASPESLQRPMGTLPDKFPGDVPDDLDIEYLFTVYESIREWGYADGPFYAEYMPAYKFSDGSIYLKGSHRTAVLQKLGFKDIKVLLTEPGTAWETWTEAR